jgi:glutamate-ammonia-ligase adenylyltransferase
MMQRLAVDSPVLREVLTRAELSQHARRNLDRFLSSAGTTSERYGAILRSPAAVERALTVFEHSELLTDILVRHPEEVALLNRAVEPVQSDGPKLFSEVPGSERSAQDSVFHYLAKGELDRAEAMSILRQQYRHSVFLSGALDLFGRRDIFESLKHNTMAADAAIEAALAMSSPPPDFAVMALGRLGTQEFDLLSDADALFVCGTGCSRELAGRVAEQFMEALTAYTRDGSVFPVDARLRPHGREGELIVTPAQLEAYFRDEAKPWEALTYLKLRYVAGNRRLADDLLGCAADGVAEIAAKPEFIAELRDVRARLERSESAYNLKTWVGGSYDIDYIVGMLQAKHRIWSAGNLQERLSLLRNENLLPEDHFQRLRQSAGFLRTVEHIVRLVSGRARKWLPAAEHPRRSVQKLLWRNLQTEDSFDPEIRLVDIMRGIRELYTEYLSG